MSGSAGSGLQREAPEPPPRQPQQQEPQSASSYKSRDLPLVNRITFAGVDVPAEDLISDEKPISTLERNDVFLSSNVFRAVAFCSFDRFFFVACFALDRSIV